MIHFPAGDETHYTVRSAFCIGAFNKLAYSNVKIPWWAESAESVFCTSITLQLLVRFEIELKTLNLNNGLSSIN